MKFVAIRLQIPLGIHIRPAAQQKRYAAALTVLVRVPRAHPGR